MAKVVLAGSGCIVRKLNIQSGSLIQKKRTVFLRSERCVRGPAPDSRRCTEVHEIEHTFQPGLGGSSVPYCCNESSFNDNANCISQPKTSDSEARETI